ncbi:hypothetical protein [Erythrobacter sp. THAF29]|uniref:hypothetical protein n=1 Tax=Erythrobacter sp. THAF29 TaxID=2587851 RepID=UPI001268C28B|nr:hypothetical protein [Erythrobacter sp. THAF29]QFT78503.1 hypothetical protein FIU90_13205 [Erythrobacter sp. THAF29]
MSQRAFYRAFGLVIASEQHITSLDQVESQPHDVEIKRVSLDHQFDESGLQTEFANWKAGPYGLLLRIDDVADLNVRDGQRIEIKPAIGASDEVISAFLMGSAFATLLQQRRLLTLHASAVMGPRGAALFVGRSGIGKSTTMSALLACGYKMVTDDVAAIGFGEDGVPRIRPSFPGARLTARALKKLGKSEREYRRLDAEIEKFAFPTSLVGKTEIGVDCVFVLDVGAESEVAVRQVSQGEAFQSLSRYTFRKRFYDGMGMQDFHFDAVSRLAAAIPVWNVVRPEHPFLLDELINRLVDRIETTPVQAATDARRAGSPV